MSGSGHEFVSELLHLFRAVERGSITSEQGIEQVALRWGYVQVRIPKARGLARERREIPCFERLVERPSEAIGLPVCES
jgi:hypothetical protein